MRAAILLIIFVAAFVAGCGTREVESTTEAIGTSNPTNIITVDGTTGTANQIGRLTWSGSGLGACRGNPGKLS